jgi:two-component system chemotaxis response regulator CheY
MRTANTSADSKTVFLVDDDSSSADLYSKGLEQAGFKISSALDTQKAVEALSNLSADLIILDLMAAKRNGLELLEALRADTRYKDVPVLLLCNAYLPELAQKALKAGGSKALPRSECTSSQLISISHELVRTPVAGTPATEVAEQLKKTLAEEGSNETAGIRELCARYAEIAGSAEGKECLEKIYQGVRFLSTRAGLAGCGKIAQLSGTVEAMLFDQVLRRNGAMSPSTTQTLVQAVECLEWLFSSGNMCAVEPLRKARVLLVDDDSVSNRANETALKRANYEPVSESNPLAA